METRFFIPFVLSGKHLSYGHNKQLINKQSLFLSGVR